MSKIIEVDLSTNKVTRILSIPNETEENIDLYLQSKGKDNLFKVDSIDYDKVYTYENGVLSISEEETNANIIKGNDIKAKIMLSKTDFSVLPDNPLGLTEDELEEVYQFRYDLRNVGLELPMIPTFLSKLGGY